MENNRKVSTFSNVFVDGVFVLFVCVLSCVRCGQRVMITVFFYGCSNGNGVMYVFRVLALLASG